jgi:hypothetical protein
MFLFTFLEQNLCYDTKYDTNKNYIFDKAYAIFTEPVYSKQFAEVMQVFIQLQESRVWSNATLFCTKRRNLSFNELLLWNQDGRGV